MYTKKVRQLQKNCNSTLYFSYQFRDFLVKSEMKRIFPGSSVDILLTWYVLDSSTSFSFLWNSWLIQSFYIKHWRTQESREKRENPLFESEKMMILCFRQIRLHCLFCLPSSQSPLFILILSSSLQPWDWNSMSRERQIQTGIHFIGRHTGNILKWDPPASGYDLTTNNKKEGDAGKRRGVSCCFPSCSLKWRNRSKGNGLCFLSSPLFILIVKAVSLSKQFNKLLLLLLLMPS